MALMYPWATKEYLLWNMSIGQIILYNNIGSEQKFGKPEAKEDTLVGKSYDELKAVRDQMERDGLIEPKHTREALKQTYGKID